MRQEEFRLPLRCFAGTLAIGLTLVSGIRAAEGNDAGEEARQTYVMVGATEAAPAVVWITGRPSNPDQVHGTGEAANLVKALESVLPAGWTIWAPENLERTDQAEGEPVSWTGNGNVWPDVIEELAGQKGVAIVADVLKRRAVIDMHAQVNPGPIRMLDANQADALHGPAEDASLGALPAEHPLYRQYATPGRLSAEPLPDTIGRIAWRFVPVGVQIDLSALGVYVNAPVFQWDISSVSVSPKAALETLMPEGYCIDEADFPTVRATICTSEQPDSNTKADGTEERDDSAS
ncbi:MAG: hypothetical protein F4Y00_07905 [Bacteroidetes bacterium SB0662_bin_6]|nr:hypothetical protein [Bacteroidetes bacterium SB0662_bin_6]MYI35405.1 hypothetical protein [Acidimicrobiaceae bacterium]